MTITLIGLELQLLDIHKIILTLHFDMFNNSIRIKGWIYGRLYKTPFHLKLYFGSINKLQYYHSKSKELELVMNNFRFIAILHYLVECQKEKCVYSMGV